MCNTRRARDYLVLVRASETHPHHPFPRPSYTGVAGELAVDFVADVATGYAAIASSVAGPFTTIKTSSFEFQTIGYMHQAKLPFNITTPGTAGFYKVGTASGESTVYSVFPTPERADNEVFAVFGDFGLANDECISSLVAEAAKGTFDSVLHVGALSQKCFPRARRHIFYCLLASQHLLLQILTPSTLSLSLSLLPFFHRRLGLQLRSFPLPQP